jgi:hypothetical protein
MGMKHDADRGVFLSRRVIAALDAPGRSGKNDLGHDPWNLDRAWLAFSPGARQGTLDGHGWHT